MILPFSLCISIDHRFYAIVCPLATGRAAKNMKAFLISAWVLAFLEASPQVRQLGSNLGARFELVGLSSTG